MCTKSKGVTCPVYCKMFPKSVVAKARKIKKETQDTKRRREEEERETNRKKNQNK